MTINQAVAAADESPWKRATLVVNGYTVPWNEPVILRSGQPNNVRVQVPAEIATTLSLDLIDDGGLSISAAPAFGTWNELDTIQFVWYLTPGEKSGRVSFVFYSREVDAVWAHSCTVVPILILRKEIAEIQIGDNPGSSARIFFRDEIQPFAVIPKEDSFMPYIGVRLEEELLGENPELVVTPSGPNLSLTWEVRPPARSGQFRLNLRAPTLYDAHHTLIYVLSRNLVDEVQDVVINGAVYAEGITINRDELQTISVRVVSGSPLLSLMFYMSLHVFPISGLVPEDWIVTKTLKDWTIKVTKPGTFRLELEGPSLSMGPNIKLPVTTVV